MPSAAAAMLRPFRNAVQPVWCAGCGDFAVLDALAAALAGSGRPVDEVAVVSGIGCSSRLPGYLACHGFNAIHGRALPIACGLKQARPDLTVVVTTGDGDGFAIGRRHIAPTVERNPNLTWIVMDNGVYGLTKGQVSPTTPLGAATRMTPAPAGNVMPPVNPLALLLDCGALWIAQGNSADPKGLAALIQAGIAYPGFAFINVISPCPVFRGGMALYQDLRACAGAPHHDIHDRQAALRVANDSSQVWQGLIYAADRTTQSTGHSGNL